MATQRGRGRGGRGRRQHPGQRAHQPRPPHLSIVPSGHADPGGAEQQPLLRMIRQSLRTGKPSDLLMVMSTFLEVAYDRTDGAFSEMASELSLAELVDSFLDIDITETTAALTVIETLIEDDLLRRRIQRGLTARRQPLPPWLRGLHEARCGDSVIMLTDILGDGDSYLFEVVLPAGGSFTALVYIDHNVAGVVKDGFIAPETLATLQASILRRAQDERPDVVPADPMAARAQMIAALELGLTHIDVPTTDTWPACRPLIEWAVRLLPPGGTAPEYPSWPPHQRLGIAAAFHASPFSQGSRDSVSRSLMEPLLDFACTLSGGDPYRWSPVRVEMLLTGWAPQYLLAPPGDLARLPDLLRRYIGYCHDRLQIPAGRTADTLHAVDRCEAEYIRLIGDGPDPETLRILDDLTVRLFNERRASFSFETYMRDQLEQRAGGAGALADLDSSPLPDEPFEWTGINEDIVDGVGLMLADCDRIADSLLGLEYRTAMRRLLHQVAIGDPLIFRRNSSPARGAAAIAWIIHRANDEDVPDNISVQDLLSAFGVRGSVSQRAEPMLRAIGVDPRNRGMSMALGQPGLLTSGSRAAMVRTRELLDDPEMIHQMGWDTHAAEGEPPAGPWR